MGLFSTQREQENKFNRVQNAQNRGIVELGLFQCRENALFLYSISPGTWNSLYLWHREGIKFKTEGHDSKF